MNSSCEYTGKIVQIANEKVTVCIEQHSACASCHTKGACSSADSSSKLIEANYHTKNFIIGETVKIIGKKHFGLKAVLYAFVIPVVLMIGTMILLQFYFTSELYIAMGALLIMLPYYMVLYFMNNILKTQLMFYVEKINN